MAKDLTKYRINGTDKFLPKSRTVLACLTQFFKDVHVTEHPNSSWPDEIQGKMGVVKKIDEVENPRYYFMDEALSDDNGNKYVVCNQWGAGNFSAFISHAAKMGYPLESNTNENLETNLSFDDVIQENASIDYQKFIEEEFTKATIFPGFRELISSISEADRKNFLGALTTLTELNTIPFLKAGFVLATLNWTEDEDEDLSNFISEISDLIDGYEPSLLNYVVQRKDFMFAVANGCHSYDIGFEKLNEFETKVFWFGMVAAGFDHEDQVNDDLSKGKLKHTISSIYFEIFRRLDTDDEYSQSQDRLCHLLTASIDDHINGSPLEFGSMMKCLGQVVWGRYQINFGDYVSKTEMFSFKSTDFWGFNFEYPVDFNRLAQDILIKEGLLAPVENNSNQESNSNELPTIMSSGAAILHLAWCVATIDKKEEDSNLFTPEEDAYHTRIRDVEKISITWDEFNKQRAELNKDISEIVNHACLSLNLWDDKILKIKALGYMLKMAWISGEDDLENNCSDKEWELIILVQNLLGLTSEERQTSHLNIID